MLDKKQIEVILKNWFEVLDLTDRKLLKSEAKPSFTSDIIKKYNIPHITKFAEWYTLHELTHKKTKEKYYFFIVEDSKFEKLHLHAIMAYWNLISGNIVKSRKPHVFVCVNYLVDVTHIPINLLPCLYRFVSLCELQPRLGSENAIKGFIYNVKAVDPKDFKLCPHMYTGKILSSDVDVKMCNGIPGDVIIGKRILFEGSPYSEIFYRTVESVKASVIGMDLSGISPGVQEID
ncbi:MAG: hypothetical protein LBD75_00245 [Candidatus Peribacteria bacterium]|jgi:hypothetical protein|nr:hypothetical protein [Candidatus Peribacteria bacterium]